MNISMWTLSKHLASYKPKVNIIEGEKVLQNVRLFSDDVKMSLYTVYLSLSENRVLCINGHDMLVLETSDINQVFNDILDIFEYYNKWSYSLEQAIMSGCTAFELLRLGSQVLDYFLLIVDATYLVHEQYCSENYLQIFPYVKELLPERMLPLDTIIMLNGLQKTHQSGIRPYNISVKDRVSTAVRNIFVSNKNAGWIVVVQEEGKIFDEAEFDAIDELGLRLEQWIQINQNAEDRMEINGVFLSLLDGDPRKMNADEKKQLSLRLATLGWNDDDQLQFYIIRQPNVILQNWSVLDTYFRNIHGGCVVFSYQDFFILTVNHSLANWAELEDDLRYLLKRYGYKAAKSPVFSDITLFKEYYYATRSTLIYGPKTDDISDFTELILPYMLALIREHAVVTVSHPCLHILQQYDNMHGTQLYHTLFVFLQCERNYTTAAETLMIHRSTLIYRVNRITDLTGVDFDDSTQRFYVLLSFMLEKTRDEF